jgi:hypothetical protein
MNTIILQYQTPTPVISVAEIKEHLKIDASNTSEDTYLFSLINSATSFFEKYTKRDILAKKYLLEGTAYSLNFPISLFRSKVFQIDSVTYLLDDVWETLASTEYLNLYNNNYGILLSKSTFSSILLDENSPNFKIVFWAGFNAKKISSAVMLNGTVTVTTTLAHNFLSGQKIIITGANETYFNGTFIITKTGANTFTYTATGANATATGELMANDVPDDIKTALKQIVASLWASRGDCEQGLNASIELTEQGIPTGALLVLKQYKIYEVLS